VNDGSGTRGVSGSMTARRCREELQRVLLDRLRAVDRLDFSCVPVDALYVQAKRGRGSPKSRSEPG
jgi:hypothetical protein